MLDEPLASPEVKRLITDILEEGDVEFTGHAFSEMAQDSLSELDVVNVLRGGRPSPGEFDKGTWRYRISTARISVVIAFRSPTWLVVITAWRE
jgi:hypothetical protein